MPPAVRSATTAATASFAWPSCCSRAVSSPAAKSRRASSATAARRASLGCSGRIRLITVRSAALLGRQQLQAHLLLDLARDFRVLLQEYADIVLALPDTLTLVAVPGAGLVDDALLAAQFDDLALAGDAHAVHDLEFGRAERRGDLVLDHLHAGHVADHFLAILDGTDATDVQPHRGVELQRIAAGGGLRTAEHDADLHADLVDEDHHGVRALDVASELAQRLGHQTRMQTHLHFAHLAFDFGFRCQRRDRVDDYQVHRARTYQHVGDFQCLLARVRLRHEQITDIHAEFLGIGRIQCMLGVDERRGAAGALHLSDDLQGERGLAGRFRSEHFDHTTARQAADAKRDVQSQRSGGHGLHVPDGRRIAQTHHRSLAKLLLDLSECGVECLLAILFHACGVRVNFRSANYLTSAVRSEPHKHGNRSFLREVFLLYTVLGNAQYCISGRWRGAAP